MLFGSLASPPKVTEVGHAQLHAVHVKVGPHCAQPAGDADASQRTQTRPERATG
jgi:hypothetical protein